MLEQKRQIAVQNLGIGLHVETPCRSPAVCSMGGEWVRLHINRNLPYAFVFMKSGGLSEFRG
jgi:hypothetical protein